MSRLAPLIAVTAIGTDWMFSARFCAVTTMTSSWPDSAAVAASGAACAGPNAHIAPAQMIADKTDLLVFFN